MMKNSPRGFQLRHRNNKHLATFVLVGKWVFALASIVAIVRLCSSTPDKIINDSSSTSTTAAAKTTGKDPDNSRALVNLVAATAAAAAAEPANQPNIKVEVTDWNRYNPLEIPRGKAQNLPAIRKTPQQVQREEEIVAANSNKVESERKKYGYGGEGDGKHLGGFTALDVDGISENVWRHMITDYGIHSMMDVGCGRGVSTTWFLKHGVDILCVEGSHDAVENSMLPDPATQVVEHDFSRGPWWPEKTYDMVWSVEFLEHVNVQYHFNYITTFRKAALIFVSSSIWGGWHHVEVHTDDWWIRKYEAYGFKYDSILTEQVKRWAREGDKTDVTPLGTKESGFHIYRSMKVFVNPVVAALPQHAHLFPEFGCYDGKKDENGKLINKECGTDPDGHLETPLAPNFYPLKITPDMDEEWRLHIQKHLNKTAVK